MAQRRGWLAVRKGAAVELIIGNQHVSALADRLGWKAETLIECVKDSLPRPLEQSFYLILTTDWRAAVQPETFRKIYQYFTNGQWMHERDLQDRVLRPNVYVNKGERIIGLVSMSLSLLDWQMSHRLRVGWLTVAHMVSAYAEAAENIFELIAENLDYIMEVCDLQMVRPKAFAVIAKAVADHAANTQLTRSAPNVADVDDIIRAIRSARFLGEESEEE